MEFTTSSVIGLQLPIPGTLRSKLSIIISYITKLNRYIAQVIYQLL